MLYDSDSVSSHLHSHTSHTFKEYNDQFMTRGSDDLGAKRLEKGARRVDKGARSVEKGARRVEQEARWAADPFTSLALKGRTRFASPYISRHCPVLLVQASGDVSRGAAPGLLAS